MDTRRLMNFQYFFLSGAFWYKDCGAISFTIIKGTLKNSVPLTIILLSILYLLYCLIPYQPIPSAIHPCFETSTSFSYLLSE